MIAFDKKIAWTVTARELLLVSEALSELLNDSDLIWGNADGAEDSRRYDEIKRLADRLDKLIQLEVIPN